MAPQFNGRRAIQHPVRHRVQQVQRIAVIVTILSAGIAASTAAQIAPIVAAVAAIDERPTRLLTGANGISIRVPDDWTSREEGGYLLLSPSPVEDASGPALMCIMSSEAWDPALDLANQDVVQQIEKQFGSNIPGYRSDGKPSSLAGTLRLRFVERAKEPGDAAARNRIHVLAKVIDGHLIALALTGASEHVLAGDADVRAMFATVQWSAPQLDTQTDTTTAATHDPSVAGHWRAEETYSSPAGSSDFGGTSLVIDHHFELKSDGTYGRGSQSAGGNGNVSVGAAFTVTERGRWSTASSDGVRHIVLARQDGSAGRLRYALHEGQLVLGEPGHRTFYSRVR